MIQQTNPKYPVFVMCGSDPKRRRLLQVLDPDEKYKSKAMLPFLGKRVIDWQLEELKESPYVEDLYLIGLTEEDVRFDYPVKYVPSETTADFPDKLMDGLNYLKSLGESPEMVVISTSDTPAMRLESINEFFEKLSNFKGYDFVLSLVPEKTIVDLYPQSGRVVARFLDHQVFPGELYALSTRAIFIGQEIIHEFNKLRREIDRQRRKISLGPVLRYIARKPQTWLTILKYLLKCATLEDVERAFSAAFDCKAKGIIIPDAGFGMDMDLPEDYERLKMLVKKTKQMDE
jgi:NDP-sugar pyrophosphorylase family protein